MKPLSDPDPRTVMNRHRTLDLGHAHSKRRSPQAGVVRPVFALGLAAAWLASTTAHAVDGCLVMLCLAAPDWKQIPQCVPTIHQLHKDLAMGKPFPTCKDAGPGNNMQHEWAVAPNNCPPQYTHVFELEAGPSYSCDFMGVITVIINGAPFTRTWWTEGDNVTEFSPAAKAQLGSWDPRFDADFAAWLAAQPVVPMVDPI